jgi:hypothetical protein
MLLASLVRFPFKGDLFDFQLLNAPLELVEFDRLAVDLHSQP